MKIVITYGTFDLLHHGHVRLLKRARQHGDFLIVGLSTDQFNKTKGKRAILTYEQRKEVLQSLSCVDMVIREVTWEQKVTDIETYDAKVLVMGDDWKGKFDHLPCVVVYQPRTDDISTSKIKELCKT